MTKVNISIDKLKHEEKCGHCLGELAEKRVYVIVIISDEEEFFNAQFCSKECSKKIFNHENLKEENK